MSTIKSKEELLENIYFTNINGNIKDSCLLIKQYGSDFWRDYREYLSEFIYPENVAEAYIHFSNIVVAYHILQE